MPRVRQPSEVRPPDARRVAPGQVESFRSRTLRRALDDQLFTSGPWLAIDEANAPVKGVRPATLGQALGLVGQGRVASVVGTLRSEVVGVDIDSPAFAGEILDTLVAFCSARSLWHLVRPSGGADGRAHLLLVPGVHHDELEDLVARLRRELGRKADPVTGRRAAPLGRHHVDVRQQLRPLSAPHRCKPTPLLDEDVLAGALAQLSDALQELSPRIREARDDAATAPTESSPTKPTRPARGEARAAAGLVEPLSPLPRPHQDLPAGWADYLRAGRSAAAEAGLDREPGSRSTIEYDATRAMVLAGWREDQAWQAIAAAHRSAFVKARSNGRRWWWHVWNYAVSTADSWLSEHRAAAAARGTSSTVIDEAVAWAIARADAELEALWRSWPAQARHTRRELMRCVLERMRRRGTTAVALPQRDVLLDAVIDSRNTVAAARDALIAAGLLEVASTHQRGSTDTADTWCLPQRFSSPTTTPGPEGAGRGVGRFEPSRDTPPHPATPLPLPLRRSLGLPRAHLLEAARALPGPLTPAVLAHAAGITRSPRPSLPWVVASEVALETALTREQERTMRGHLQALAAHQLVVVDAHGRWNAAEPASVIDAGADQDVGAARLEYVALEQLGRDRQDTIRRAVASERREYRAAVDPTARRHRWEAQRQQVFARQAKVDLARQKAWWDGLDEHARRVQAAAAAAVFAALSPAEQAQRKHQLAVRRARVGLVERDRYTAWWNGLSSQDRDKRSVTRAWAYHRLPADTRASLAGAWSEHRARWDLPQPRRSSPPPVEGNDHDPTPDLLIDLTASPPEEAPQSLLDLLGSGAAGSTVRSLTTSGAR